MGERARPSHRRGTESCRRTGGYHGISSELLAAENVGALGIAEVLLTTASHQWPECSAPLGTLRSRFRELFRRAVRSSNLAVGLIAVLCSCAEDPGPPASVPATAPKELARPSRDLPNLVLVLVDDQGWTGTSVSMDPTRPGAQSDFYRTPHLERFAAQSMRFSNAYAPSPLCSPSRASIQTGKSPQMLGMTDNISAMKKFEEDYQGKRLRPPRPVLNLPEEEITIAEALKRSHPEMVTAHFGKWHVEADKEKGPGFHGYDVHDGATGNKDGIVGGQNPKDIFGMTDRVNQFMETQVRSGKRFFVQMSHYALHAKVTARRESSEFYRGRTRGEHHHDPVYAGMTQDLDTGFGLLLDKIDELGIADNTYVFYTSDNGAYTTLRDFMNDITSNHPLSGEKGMVLEGGIRVPFLVRGPGIESGTVSDVPVIGWDLLPTLCDLAQGAEVPADIEGGSLRPVLENGGAGQVVRPRDSLYWHMPHYVGMKNTTPQSAMRTGDLKMIVHYESEEARLFDLSQDVGEASDLAESAPEKVKEMQRDLRKYLRDIDAPMARRGKEEG